MASSPISEIDILKPIDPSLSNEDDWPDFLLTAAEVSDTKTGQLVSLLQAGPDFPLQLVGKLSKSKDTLQYLTKDRSPHDLPARVAISPVTHFCYGQDDEAQAIVWAAGTAGWFQIQPSRQYKTLHKRSCEAVNALYFLADLHGQAKGKKSKQLSIDYVFRRYAEDSSHRCANSDEAKQKLLSHQVFLLDCMRKGREGINWKNTPIYNFLDYPPEDSSEADGSGEHTPQANDASDLEHSGRGAGKSSLRPRSAIYSLKGMGRRTNSGSTEDAQTATEQVQSPLKRKAKIKVLGPRKRGAASEEPNSNSASEGDSSDASAPEPQLPLLTTPLKPNAANRREPRVRIVEEPLPSYEPQGPGDTWLCTFDGCSHRVYDARKARNQELIQEHYKEHAHESQAQLDLIYQEERPYLPVNNLIKRIRDMASQSKYSDDASNQDQVMSGTEQVEFPKPIRRKWP